MNDILHMLFGAALVALGVLAGATADRIRGLRAQRRIEASVPRERRRTPEAIPATSAQTAMAREVALALATMGFTKAVAMEAVAACKSCETSTHESWLRAALKRCAPKEARA